MTDESLDESLGEPIDHSTDCEPEFAASIAGQRIALVGRLGSMNRREAKNLLASYGASVVNVADTPIDCIVIGADEPPLAETELLSQRMLDAAAAGELNIWGEAEFWQQLGLLDNDQSDRQLYTPAMLAHLLGVSVRVIRRWHRRGLITAVHTLHRLPYFDFQEVATARRLAHWIASGASQQAIEQRLVELVNVLPRIQRPLDQLSILIEGKHVLLRQGEGLLDLGGQLRFDFDSADDGRSADTDEDGCQEPPDPPRHILSLSDEYERRQSTRLVDPRSPSDDLLEAAFAAEDADDLEAAMDFCHAILARDGARADICFQLAELLYRTGHVIAARERYYAAIELEPDFVEARASLANVLAEAGQNDLAIAAFRGAIALHPQYVEAHFGLAKLLDKLGQELAAQQAWKQVIELSPTSPWAAEARLRLK